MQIKYRVVIILLWLLASWLIGYNMGHVPVVNVMEDRRDLLELEKAKMVLEGPYKRRVYIHGLVACSRRGDESDMAVIYCGYPEDYVNPR